MSLRKNVIAMAAAVLGLALGVSANVQAAAAVQPANSSQRTYNLKAETNLKAKSAKRHKKAAKKKHKRKSARSEMRSYVRRTMNHYHLRGRAVVVKNGRTQTVSYGYAWYGHRIYNSNRRVIYPLASLQKSLTGAIMTQLIMSHKTGKNKITQYTKISRWYPNLKGAKHITVGELMTHTSGIIVENTENLRKKHYSEAQAIKWVVRDINHSKMGKRGRFDYNNSNFILLAGIIRKVTHKSYQANVESRIIRKLNLHNTYFAHQVPRSKIRAVSYVWRKRNYQSPHRILTRHASQIPGAGNLYSTPEDYYRIQHALYNGQVLNAHEFHYMTNLKAKKHGYSGGMYEKGIKSGSHIKIAYGAIKYNHYSSWYQLTDDNQNGLIFLLNQNNTNGSEKKVKAAGYKILTHIRKNTFSRQ